jgi:sucrose phosphorylase
VPGLYFNSLIGAENWTEGVEKLGYNRAINRQKFNYEQLSHELDDSDSTKHRVYEAYTHLLHTRRGEPLFSPLATQTVLEIDPRVVAILRSNEDERLLALSNVSDGEVSLDGGKLKEVLGKNEAQDILREETFSFDSTVKLRPYQIAWLK